MAGMGPMMGVPIGNIGPKTGADFSPYLEMWRLRQANNRTGQQIALQQQEAADQRRQFEQKMAENARQFDVGTGLEKQGLGLRAEEVRGSLGLREKQVGLQEKGMNLEDLRAREGLDFRRSDAEAQREFMRDESAKDRGLQERRIDIDADKLDWTKDESLRNYDLALRGLDQKDRIVAMQEAASAIDNQTKERQLAGMMTPEQAQRLNDAKVRMVGNELERSEMELAEAMNEARMNGETFAPEHVDRIIDAVESGDLSKLGKSLTARIANNPKLMQSLEHWAGIYDAFGLNKAREAQTELTEAQAEQTQLETDVMRGGDEAAEATGPDGEAVATTPQIEELQRRREEGSLGSVGELKLSAYEKMQEVANKGGPEIETRREELNDLLALLSEYDDEDDLPGDLGFDLQGVALGRWGIPSIINRIVQEAGVGEGGKIRDLAEKYGIEP